jgi:hypothetical protein
VETRQFIGLNVSRRSLRRELTTGPRFKIRDFGINGGVITNVTTERGKIYGALKLAIAAWFCDCVTAIRGYPQKDGCKQSFRAPLHRLAEGSKD